MHSSGENVFADFLNVLNKVSTNPKEFTENDAAELLVTLEEAAKDMIRVVTRSIDLAPEWTPEELIKQKWIVSEVLERVRAVEARLHMSILLVQKGAIQKLVNLGSGAQFIARQYFDASLSVYDASYPNLVYFRDVLKTARHVLESLLDCLEIKRQFALRQIEAKLKISPQAV